MNQPIASEIRNTADATTSRDEQPAPRGLRVKSGVRAGESKQTYLKYELKEIFVSG